MHSKIQHLKKKVPKLNLKKNVKVQTRIMELYKDLNSVAFLSLQECLARGVDILVRLLSKPVWGIGCGAWNCLHCAFEILLNCVNLYL